MREPKTLSEAPEGLTYDQQVEYVLLLLKGKTRKEAEETVRR